MGRAKGGQAKIAFSRRSQPSRKVPQLRIKMDANGNSIGDYVVTSNIRTAVDIVRNSLLVGTRVIAVYGHDENPVEFAEQMSAVLSLPVERFSYDINGETIKIKAAFQETELKVPVGDSKRFIDAIQQEGALFLEGENDAALAAVQSFLSQNMGAAGPSTLEINGQTIKPHHDTAVFFPFTPVDDDARLWPTASAGAAVVSLTDQGNWDIDNMSEAVEWGDENLFAFIEDGMPETDEENMALARRLYLAYLTSASDLILNVDEGEAERLADEVRAIAKASFDDLDAFSSDEQTKKQRDALLPKAREIFENEKFLDSLGLVTARLRAASQVEGSGLRSYPASAMEVFKAARNASIDAAAGGAMSYESFIRGCDVIVEEGLRGEDRKTALTSAIGEKMLFDLSELWLSYAWLHDEQA